MIREILRDYIIGELTDITDELATYPFTTGVLTPAVFTTQSIPEDSKYPVIFIGPSLGGDRFGARGYKGGDFQCDIFMYTNKVKSLKTFENLSRDLWDGLNRGNIESYVPTGWNSWGVRADLPIGTSDKDGFPGYRILVSLRLLETS